MAAPTIAWQHATIWAFEDGVAWASIEMPSGMKHSGGWAEAANQYGPSGELAALHYSCTPTSYSGHMFGTGFHPIAGTWVNYDVSTDKTYIYVGFSCPPGQQVRAHLFTVS